MFGGFGEIHSLEDLVFALLNEIGLGIDEYGLVYDTDNGNILSFNGRQIKASVDPMNPAIPTDLFVIFDPVFDNKIMSFMLGYYLSKEQEFGNLQVNTILEDLEPIQYYNKDDNIRTKRSRVTVVTNSDKIASDYFYQKGLKYSDVILKVGRQPKDLHMFDSIPEESITVNPIVTNVYPVDDSSYY